MHAAAVILSGIPVTATDVVTSMAVCWSRPGADENTGIWHRYELTDSIARSSFCTIFFRA